MYLNSRGVIDKDCNWTFGNAHLVLIVDVMDRGDDATAIRAEGRGRALLIKNDEFWIIDDKGKMKKL